MPRFCQGSLCVNMAYRDDYCGDCQKLRQQHLTSHQIEGHSYQRIDMCPACESVAKVLEE